MLARVTGSLTIQDTSRDGRVLMTDEMRRLGLSALPPGKTKERELSWLDWSRPVGLSADGKTVLFFESGEGGGPGYSVYVRGTDGSPAVRLGEGNSLALSPDGTWALAVLHKLTDPQYVLYPTEAGQPRSLPLEGLRATAARFLPDGRHLLFGGIEPGRSERIYLVDTEGGKPRALTPEKYRGPGPDHRRREELPRARPGREGICLFRRGRRADARAGNRRRRFSTPMDRRWPCPLRAAQRRPRGADRAARPCDRTLRAVEGDPAGGLGRRRPGLLGPRFARTGPFTPTRTHASCRTSFWSRV